MTQVNRIGLVCMLMVLASPYMPNPLHPWAAWAVFMVGAYAFWTNEKKAGGVR